MPGSKPCDDWIRRVLGINIPGDGTNLRQSAAIPLVLPQAATPPAVRYLSTDGAAIWRDAFDQVATNFAALESALDEGGDANQKRIARAGLPALLSRFGPELEAALVGADAAAPADQPRARDAAKAVIGQYRSVLQADRLISLLDDNPEHVSPAIRATLGGALDRIAKALDG
jgi:hypothetical protein